ncbi:MAG: histidinol dehydrogenase [Anaerolineae bacterium]|nr:histidinol dehydrogenase [Anaerolineae bacterium]
MSGELFEIYSLDEAQTSILKRVPPDEFEVTGGLLDSIESIFGERLTPEQAIKTVIGDVRVRGDAALREWSERIDKVTLDELAATPEEFEAAVEATPPEVYEALELAAERIEAFHRKQPVTSWIDPGPEGTLGQLMRPIDRVGVYVPGGTAPLPSSMLMSAIPAWVAGVGEVVACTPPAKDGSIPAAILAAAKIAGVEKVYRLGGAQAIAAMAYGTESVPKVDKIVGPGNLFVMLAKRQVYGAVGIDGLLGPTETMVIADESAHPATIAADLLAQAEHDVLAQALLITPSRELAMAVEVEIRRQVEQRSRANIIAESLPRAGGAVIVADLDEAFEVANAYGAEHLQLSVKDPFACLGKVKHAGAVFLGESSFEVLGDYVAGPSHSLPTSGSARYASGINVLDFVKVTSVIGLEAGAAAELSRSAAIIAHAEELDGHAAAAEARIKSE